MATVGHLAMGLAAGRLGSRNKRGLIALSAWLTFVSFLPDADVVAFAFGVPYEAPFGHRGASHSFAFALLLGLATAVVWRARKRKGALLLGALTFAACATHGVLDAFTDGGKGIALLWPLSNARYFAPWQPIPVAPIGLGFLSPRGLLVAGTELLMFAPLLVYALWPRARRRHQ